MDKLGMIFGTIVLATVAVLLLACSDSSVDNSLGGGCHYIKLNPIVSTTTYKQIDNDKDNNKDHDKE